MSTAAEALPDDVAALRALLRKAWDERDAERAEKARLAAERDRLTGQNDRLRHLIRQLQRMQFGKRSEKLDPDQLNLGLEDLEQALAAEEAGSPRLSAGAGILASAAQPAIQSGSAADAIPAQCDLGEGSCSIVTGPGSASRSSVSTSPATSLNRTMFTVSGTSRPLVVDQALAEVHVRRRRLRHINPRRDRVALVGHHIEQEIERKLPR